MSSKISWDIKLELDQSKSKQSQIGRNPINDSRSSILAWTRSCNWPRPVGKFKIQVRMEPEKYIIHFFQEEFVDLGKWSSFNFHIIRELTLQRLKRKVPIPLLQTHWRAGAV